MKSKSYEVKDCLGYWISKVARTVELDFETRLKAYNMTRSGYVILHFIEDNAFCSPSDIASHLNFDRSVMTRQLDALETQGLVQRNPSSQDRRSLSIALTKEGKALVPKLIQESKTVSDKIRSALSEDEVQKIKGCLQKILESDFTPSDSI